MIAEGAVDRLLKQMLKYVVQNKFGHGKLPMFLKYLNIMWVLG